MLPKALDPLDSIINELSMQLGQCHSSDEVIFKTHVVRATLRLIRQVSRALVHNTEQQET